MKTFWNDPLCRLKYTIEAGMERNASDDDSSVVECETFIAAPPEVVCPFLVEPELMEHWIGTFRAGSRRAEGAFAIAMGSGHVARGAYSLLLPPHRISFTWGWEGKKRSEWTPCGI